MTQIQKSSEANLTTKGLFGQISVKKRFEELLGKKAANFISSVLQVVGNNKLLSNADPQTVLTAAATAATLDLPINQNLGYAWIVPYKGQAQFQMGWRGYVQLALRTAEYQRINTTIVYQNQFKSWNAMKEELDADFEIEGSGKVAGYVAYFRLNNGFEKTVYWSVEKVEVHAKKYSQAYKSGGKTPWSTDFDDMALKTVLKNTLSKWGILSIEMQRAIEADQSTQEKEGDYTYQDNQPATIDITEINRKEEYTRAEKFINKAKTKEEVADIYNSLDPQNQLEIQDLVTQKTLELS
jgi:recombination protein RecT